MRGEDERNRTTRKWTDDVSGFTKERFKVGKDRTILNISDFRRHFEKGGVQYTG